MGKGYARYSGPLDEETGKTGDRPIDIGVYEYQYFSKFQTMEKIYVATEESGDKSGSSWANATSDLRGAIVGASNPTVNDGDRTVYVRDGEYSLPRLSAGAAYVLNMSDRELLSDGLTVKGSCTGVGEEQNFSNQSVIRNHENSEKAGTLLTVNSNDKYVRIEGFTFINDKDDGIGISANAGTGSFTLANSAMRGNSGSGLKISDNNSGKVLIYNTLFADGGTGLTGGDNNVTLVNTTFANNGTDMTGTPNVYNSVSWNNGTQNMSANTDNKLFVSFASEAEALTNNANIQSGPNFVDPLNKDIEQRDYHIRPSLTLLNAGANDNYVNHVLHQIGYEDANAIPETERDLGNNKRLTDNTIDIGAYEYEAPLQPIVYVKADLVSPTKDGRSWQTALDDLQGVADLVGIYASQHTDDNASGYVFVHNNVKNRTVSLTLPNTKVYGGMNDETSTASDVTEIVSELLSKRSGLIERASDARSTLTDVTVNASGAVVDGFEVSGNVNLGNGGYLSTSVVKEGSEISGTGTGEGILYNTLVYGDVQNVKAVNVTATGTITGSDGSGNNRASVTETNTYVTDDEWKYQLMEISDDIDGGKALDETNACIYFVGHSRDIAGNNRIRIPRKVDNGCFETWDINTGDGEIIATDYPHGKSVVYVREGNELSINGDVYNTASPFNPGVLLLEHQAGLRGNGNSVLCLM